MENETIKERFLGTIFGQAVGDALGLSTEFMSKQEVDRFYPNGIEDYSQIVQDDHRRRWQRGDWTDDTDMMLCILDSFVACQKVDILDVARRFKEWMMNGGMGIGRHTYNVMALGDYTSNPQKAAEIIWKMGKKKAAANGAVMRTSVVGLMKDNVASNAENICKLTHYDPRCVGSCVIVSSIIHALVFEDRILDYEFNISDFNEPGKAFGEEELQAAIKRGAIQILDDATIEAMKAKRARDKARDAY